jgi:hypothetical protein
VIEKSSKGAILRGPTEKKFQKEIEDLYEGNRFLNGTKRNGVVVDSEATSVVRDVVNDGRDSGSSLSDGDDFYQHGVDSLKSFPIRSIVQKVDSL